MQDSGLLSLLVWLPIVGGLLVLALGEARVALGRWVALATSLLALALSVPLYQGFDTSTASFQFVEQLPWIPAFNATYHLGVDGISLPLVILTTFLMPFCILASWVSIEKRVKEYMVAFLVLETLMIGVFCALDIVLFYLFFEAGLIPMFLIIGIWGGKRRIYASFKFFLYTLAGSLLMLLAIMAMIWTAGTSDIAELLKTGPKLFSRDMQFWLWLAF
ncbi:MAG: proton-conducting transporter membrane subunit, partial [Hyphomicrobiales bacterium]